MGNKAVKPFRPFSTHGGASVPHRKNTAEMESVVMPAPSQVTIPMLQHIGAPCVATVKVGDTVKVGQRIGDSEQPISAPIHASVSGVVKAIVETRTSSGASVPAVVIASDGKMEPAEELAPVQVDDAASLVAAARASGLVGLGGAGFPTHVKLAPPQDKPIDTLVVNCAECEPYITTDYRECIENSWDVLAGVYTVKRLLGIRQVFIAVEDNKPEAIRILREIADDDTRDPQREVSVVQLKSRYPQGAEKVLVRAVTGRRIPPGKLPADVGVLVMNVTSVAFLARYMKTGMPLVSRRVTVDGSAVKTPRNVIVPIGTPIGEIFEFAGGFCEEPKKILMGGPMMGVAVEDLSAPLLKQNNAILAFGEREAQLREPTPCIRCGRCVAACPMSLMPLEFMRLYRLQDAEGLAHRGLPVCIECGSCAYACPANRPLVQTIRLGKQLLREKGVR